MARATGPPGLRKAETLWAQTALTVATRRGKNIGQREDVTPAKEYQGWPRIAPLIHMQMVYLVEAAPTKISCELLD